MDAGSIDLVAVWQPAASRIRVRIAAFAVSASACSRRWRVRTVVAGRRLAGGLEQPLSPAAMAVAAALAALLAAGSRFAMPSDFPWRIRSRRSMRALAAVATVGDFRRRAVGARHVDGRAWRLLGASWPRKNAGWLRFRTAVARAGVRSPRSARHRQLPNESRELPLAVSRVANRRLAPCRSHAAPARRAAIRRFRRKSCNNRPASASGQTAWIGSAVGCKCRWRRANGTRRRTSPSARRFLNRRKISLRQTAGPAGRIRAVQILPHGVRLELKLDFSPRQPQRVSVEFVAESRLG